MSTICPYPGLRPFNENESIFFKGRDEHIKKIIAQLAKNKFVMITGASGDGKSSLIYAGVIPNAKAGFFKAKHNNWIVADFRPERSPVTNMALALTRQLGYQDQQQVEKELGYGFSSLVDLFTKSEFALDTSAEAFLQADAETQKQSKRKAANLLILVDQFEELFTNAENYSNDQPSIEAQTAVNLLIETSRIALEKDIPIYVVCTMRSDYIGQCSAFRGLPELIGFSQFFVPRLKRKEIQQVIVDPAILSGNRISNRLTQTLINELGDGLDQLPVLQHALNQIWKAAGDGTSEMDLIHLAKAGGLKREQLPEEDKAVFDEWYNTLPEFKKALLKKPSLENVLNAHANELYETAHEVYNQTHETPISQQTAQFIIKKAFQGLTKTDQGRTVRNRMTLQEITNVIYSDAVTTEMVGAVLDIFRMPGNTFLRPFVNSESEYTPLKSTDILDITHESLIRNWRLLSSWAGEEYQNILTYRDFKKQAERWWVSHKSNDYLLPIGPLTFFEGWLLKQKPNKYLIAKYDETNAESVKLSNSEYWLNMGQEFIDRSARKLFFTRFVMKYGAARIAACIAALIVVSLAAYGFVDYRAKLNENVLPGIEEQCFAYLDNKTVTDKEKANFLVNEEILHPGSLQSNLLKLKIDTVAIDVTLAVTAKIIQQSVATNMSLPDFAPALVALLTTKMKSYLHKNEKHISESKANRIIYYMDVMRFASLKYPDTFDSTKLKTSLDSSSLVIRDNYIKSVLNSNPPINFNGITMLNAVRYYMVQQRSDTLGFKSMVNAISPLENPAAAGRFSKLFPANISVQLNDWGRGANYSSKGGYIVLANLYSGLGDCNKLSDCIDSIYTQTKDYSQQYTGDFSELFNFYMFFPGVTQPALEKVIERYSKISSISKSVLVEKAVNEINELQYVNFIKGSHYRSIHDKMSRENFTVLWDMNYNLITGKVVNGSRAFGFMSDSLRFKAANYFKMRGIKVLNLYQDTSEALVNLQKFKQLYTEISREYLDGDRIFKVGVSICQKRTSYILLFPSDLLYQMENHGYINDYPRMDDGSIYFQEFVTAGCFTCFYSNKDQDLFVRLLYGYYPYYNLNELGSLTPTSLKEKVFARFIENAKHLTYENDGKSWKDDGIIKLYHIERKFKTGDDSAALKEIQAWGVDNMITYFKANQSDFKEDVIGQLIKNIGGFLAQNNRIKESFAIMSTLEPMYEKRNSLILNGYAALYKNDEASSAIYLDSVINMIGEDRQFGLALLTALGRTDKDIYLEKLIDLIGRLSEKKKNDALANYIWGIAQAGAYYKAEHTIPQFLSHDRQFKILNGIVVEHVRRCILKGSVNKKDLLLVTVGSAEGWTSNDWENNMNQSESNVIIYGIGE